MFVFYKVGGSVRDNILGLSHKDVGFCVLCDDLSILQTYLKEDS